MINRPIKRLFTFGCSFTKYHWSCWPEIIAEELNIPVYNYGESGAGNQFISNMISQADQKHKFDTDDLVMVCWSNVCREDRWNNGQWFTPGNIYTQNIYDDEYVKKWADPLGYLIRDSSTISLCKGYLQSKNCQYHFFSICDLDFTFDQNEKNCINKKYHNIYENLCDIYRSTLKMPNFYNLLWHNDIHEHKFKNQKKIYQDYFDDGHPTPIEHLNFLQLMFPNYGFKKTTIDKVKISDKSLTQFILEQIQIRQKRFTVYEFDQELQIKLKNTTLIKKAEHQSYI